MDNEGHHVTFGDHKWKVKRGKLSIYMSQKHGTLYMVEVSKKEARIVQGVGTSTLCHKIFSHMSEEELKKPVSSGRMQDSRNVTDASKQCSIGTQKKVGVATIGNPPKFGKSGSVQSGVYNPTSACSVEGS